MTPPVHAQFLIEPTFDSSITGDTSHTAAIEAGIDAAISRIEGDIATSATVDITFSEMSTGLGESSTSLYSVPYSTYRSVLATDATSTQDSEALASLPSTTDNPVDGNANVYLTKALVNNLGIYSVGDSDGTISLNTSIMNLSRTGTQNPSDYDIQSVAAHEIDEILGIGGPGSVLNFATSGPVGALDLFRYSASGVRSFSTSSSASSYFSINGGVTDLVHFNQAGGGAADFADWGNGNTSDEGVGNSPAQVQDAYGAPGQDVNVGSNELTALDVVGYKLTSAGTATEDMLVPEPSTYALFLNGLALLAFWQLRKRKTAL